jgi:hypothetical protein
MDKARTLKPGRGTLAALRHLCPVCGAAQGVRCVSRPAGVVLRFAHSRRMDLARAAGVQGVSRG